MALVLVIDTVSTRLGLALVRSDGWHDTLAEDMATGQAERLLPALAELLDRNGLGYADLGRIAVTTGPGSFTGVRIGLSAARGIALARAIPVLGISTLMALSLASRCDPVTVLLDARRNEAFMQNFSGPGIAASAPLLLLAEDARRRVPVGNGLFTSPLVDLIALGQFALLADPAAYPPEALYVREADAKPQERFRVARRVEPAS